MTRKIIVVLLLFVLSSPIHVVAQFRLPKLPSLDDVELPKMPSLGNKENSEGSNFTLLAGGCALLGATGAYAAKELAELAAEKQGLSSSEADQLQTNYMLGFALAGCALGTSLAEKIISNMSESARQAQEDAWLQAQTQTGPVEWEDPNDSSMHGRTELTSIETLPDGKRCGTRRDVIEAAEGTAEPYQRVCETENGWETVVI